MTGNRSDLLLIGRKVREFRRQRGLSQEELADRVDVHRNFIGFIERGERAAGLLILLRIAAALCVGPAALFELFRDPSQDDEEPGR